MSDSYLNMLNNTVINPSEPSEKKEKKSEDSKLKAATFSAATEAQTLLNKASEDVLLVSESDEPFEAINVETKLERLPTTFEELGQLGLLKGDEEDRLRIKSVPEFLRQDDYRDIVAAIKKINPEESDSKVYLVGDISITVLVLTLVSHEHQHAIIGLRSLSVQS
ncbi:hypothetical protein BY458DRAFT_520582 [Sporodiniella umbellata]|nr:hypothetical protein BY458DRAFT_520582 [Sporodiniella umbellata]